MKITRKHSPMVLATAEVDSLLEGRRRGVACSELALRGQIANIATARLGQPIRLEPGSAGQEDAARAAPARTRFWRGDEGSATIEFVIWVPLFLFILTLIADFSMIFMNHSKMWDAARDGARQMAIYNMTADEAKMYVAEKLYNTAPRIEITASDGDEVVMTVSTTIGEASPFGFFADVLTGTLVARVTMMKEPI